jgi:hypothetical protein
VTSLGRILHSLINHGKEKHLLEEYCRPKNNTFQPFEGQNGWLTFNGLQGIIFQKTGFFKLGLILFTSCK